jgi:hypothetical protein
VTNEVAQAIERQRELVKDVTDHFDARYLFRTEYGLYKFDSLCHQLNALANRVPLLVRMARFIASGLMPSGTPSALK